MILMLAGTSDARELALRMKKAGFRLRVTVVTENAAKSLRDEGLDVFVGRLDGEDMKKMIADKGFQAVVDASHPFAEEASKNALYAAKQMNVPYVRYEREPTAFEKDPLITEVDCYEEAAEYAAKQGGVIMLTTGSKTLDIFAKTLVGRSDTTLVARMLPRKENMEKCEKFGIEQKNIVAMQGPFSTELNKALYRHYGVTLVVTKESGKIGSVDEKLEAARQLGIPVVMIKRPKIDYGNVFSSYEEVIAALNHL